MNVPSLWMQMLHLKRKQIEFAILVLAYILQRRLRTFWLREVAYFQLVDLEQWQLEYELVAN